MLPFRRVLSLKWSGQQSRSRIAEGLSKRFLKTCKDRAGIIVFDRLLQRLATRRPKKCAHLQTWDLLLELEPLNLYRARMELQEWWRLLAWCLLSLLTSSTLRLVSWLPFAKVLGRFALREPMAAPVACLPRNATCCRQWRHRNDGLPLTSPVKRLLQRRSSCRQRRSSCRKAGYLRSLASATSAADR